MSYYANDIYASVYIYIKCIIYINIKGCHGQELGLQNSTIDSDFLQNIWAKLTLNIESIWHKYFAINTINRNPGSNFSSACDSTI